MNVSADVSQRQGALACHGRPRIHRIFVVVAHVQCDVVATLEADDFHLEEDGCLLEACCVRIRIEVIRRALGGCDTIPIPGVGAVAGCDVILQFGIGIVPVDY